MPRITNSFLGPSAPWMLDEEEDFDLVAYRELVRDAAGALTYSLEARVAALRSEGVSLDDLLDEIRRQATEAGASGNLGVMRELADLAMELMMAKENARRAV